VRKVAIEGYQQGIRGIFLFSLGVSVLAFLFTLGIKEYPLSASFEEEEENRKKRDEGRNV
jgi:hypothetical protein